MNDGFTVREQDLGVQDVHCSNGEDYIGKVFKVGDNYRIERPVLPNIAQDPQTGQFRVGLLPVRPWMDKVDSITIHTSQVMYLLPVPNRMLSAYNQFVSDLVLPPAGGGLDSLLGR